jgi:phosphoglycerate dehydrogenase-like enzyme
MKIFLVGEAANHRSDLESGLKVDCDIVDLPASAAKADDFDSEMSMDDVLVTLRYHRNADTAPPIGLLHVPGAGLDQITMDTLHTSTTVCNVYEHEIPIAEYVLSCVLEFEIRATQLRATFNEHTWSHLYRHREPHGEVYGKTMLLIGYGRIGRAIASRAQAFGVRVLATDDFTVDAPQGVEIHPTSSLIELLGVADYVVVACPFTPQTEGLLGRRELGQMKSSAIIINPSRAQIVDEDALYSSLASQEIAGAFLDVWYRYPESGDEATPPSNRPLLDLPNTWCTPHSSAWTRPLSGRRYALLAENINRFAHGLPLRNIIQHSRQPAPVQREERNAN